MAIMTGKIIVIPISLSIGVLLYVNALLPDTELANAAESSRAPKRIETIELPGVTGRIDHLAYDPAGGRLFIAALGNGTIEVVDLKKGKTVGTIGNLAEPQGVVFDKKTNQLFVAEGEGGRLTSYDSSLVKKNRISNLPDADNLRLDVHRNAVLAGYGDGAIASFDTGSLKQLGEAKLDGHPESFQLDDRTGTIYVNVPHSRDITVIDRTTLKAKVHWKLPAQGNYPMFDNSQDNRLFVACRKPAQLLVFDTTTGKLLQGVAMSGDCDDLFYDPAVHKLYGSCGEGFLDVFEKRKSDFERTDRLRTSPGARTSLLVPSLHRLFIAAPKHLSEPAKILVYDTQTQ